MGVDKEWQGPKGHVGKGRAGYQGFCCARIVCVGSNYSLAFQMFKVIGVNSQPTALY